MRVFGISRDTAWSHRAWTEVLDLNFPLISDWNADATRAFGVGTESRGMREVPGRSAFLVDGNGMIRGTWQYGSAEVPDFDVLLEAARSLS